MCCIDRHGLKRKRHRLRGKKTQILPVRKRWYEDKCKQRWQFGGKSWWWAPAPPSCETIAFPHSFPATPSCFFLGQAIPPSRESTSRADPQGTPQHGWGRCLGGGNKALGCGEVHWGLSLLLGLHRGLQERVRVSGFLPCDSKCRNLLWAAILWRNWCCRALAAPVRARGLTHQMLPPF